MRITKLLPFLAVVFLHSAAVSAAVVDGMAGYATQNGGTTGGAGGAEVIAGTLAEFISYTSDDTARIIRVNGELNSGDDKGKSVRLGSNKTILGCGAGAFLNGVGLTISNDSNIIIRNIKISLVSITNTTDPAVYDPDGDEGRPQIIVNGGDCISIANTSKNIWIDHCEFYAIDPHVQTNQDLYDGLVDIKNNSRYITVSWCYFHDHHKCHLVGSSDTDNYDRMTTFHHNYYYNIKERMPSYRFGSGHVFNNYYLDVISSGANTRMGACLRVENNYFEDSNDPVVTKNSTSDGNWDLHSGFNSGENSNIYVNCSGSKPVVSTCALTLPYSYTNFMDAAADVKNIVTANAGTGRITANCGGATSTFTPAATATRTRTASATVTRTYTATQINTSTATAASTFTATKESTVTFTATRTFTVTPVPTLTVTRTSTPAATPTFTVTETLIPTVTLSVTETPVIVPPSVTRTLTAALTYTLTATSTHTLQATPSFTMTQTSTATPTLTVTVTATVSATSTLTATSTSVSTMTLIPPSAAVTATLTPVFTTTLQPAAGNLTVTGSHCRPNPYNPGNGPLSMGITLSKACTGITIKIYSVSFRQVAIHTETGLFGAGPAEVRIPADRFAAMARGTYYWQAQAKSEAGETVKSFPAVLLIQK